MMRLLSVSFSVLLLLATPAFAQEVARIDSAPNLEAKGVVENPKPTWETQRQARTFQLQIPAPRGQITDRNGLPFAQSRVSYNLAINFPSPADWSDQKALAFARQQATLAEGLLGRKITFNEENLVKHYRNRGVLPYDIIEDLSPSEIQVLGEGMPDTLTLRQTYLRVYPEGQIGAHMIGYTGREAPLSRRPIQNNDLLFPESEGRDGIERIFNEQLTGQKGVLNMTYDKDGNKTSERLAEQPVPGYNVITTIDRNLQATCESILEKRCERGAIVVLNPNTGEILAMASWPTYDPNLFIPIVPPDVFEQLSNDERAPLLPRAFRSAYPPGSTFKTFLGLAALQSGAIEADSEFSCPTSYSIGKFTFRNWKKSHAGRLNFVEALEQSCNTWFYQVGIKTGSEPIIDWSHRLGLGKRTGIPLASESSGNIPTDEYMLRVHNRKILNGDIANMSIGQGDTLITPLQMAQAMGVIATGGVFHQTRLVSQIQTLDNKVIAAYPDRIRDTLPLSPGVVSTLHEGLVEVTEGGQGTAHIVKTKGISVAGKTGTAQWGPTRKQRTAAWFAGFAPADNPQIAFAAVYEGRPNDDSVHGGSHAGPIIRDMLHAYFLGKGLETKGQQTQAEPEEEAEVAEG